MISGNQQLVATTLSPHLSENFIHCINYAIQCYNKIFKIVTIYCIPPLYTVYCNSVYSVTIKSSKSLLYAVHCIPALYTVYCNTLYSNTVVTIKSSKSLLNTVSHHCIQYTVILYTVIQCYDKIFQICETHQDSFQAALSTMAFHLVQIGQIMFVMLFFRSVRTS